MARSTIAKMREAVVVEVGATQTDAWKTRRSADISGGHPLYGPLAGGPFAKNYRAVGVSAQIKLK